MLYGTTKEFLEVFGLATLDDLPQAKELRPAVERKPKSKPEAQSEAQSEADSESTSTEESDAEPALETEPAVDDAS